MPTISEEIERISKLPKQIRLAGFLARLAALDELGAQLRTGKDNSDKWSAEDEKKWDDLGDEVEAWHYALSEAEHELLRPIVNFMACLCRGEDPEENIRVTYELLPTGKYAKQVQQTNDRVEAAARIVEGAAAGSTVGWYIESCRQMAEQIRLLKSVKKNESA